MRLTSGISPAAWVLFVLLGLATAGITHVATVLALPWRSPQDAFSRVGALSPLRVRTLLSSPAPETDALPFRDPAMSAAICRYDLGAMPFRLTLSPFDGRFVTIGFHTRHGLAFYGLTIRANDATRLDLVLTPKDQDPDRPADRTTPAQVISVLAPEPEGFVIVSTPLDDGENGGATDRLSHVECKWSAADPT